MSDEPKVESEPRATPQPSERPERSAWPPGDERRSLAEEVAHQTAPPPRFEPRDLPAFEAPPPSDEFLPDSGSLRMSVPPTRHTLSVFDHEALAPGLFAVMFVGTLLALVYVMQPFIADVVLSFILVGMFQRVYERLVPFARSRWLASGLTTTLVFLLIVLPFLGLGYLIVTEATNAYGLLATGFFNGGEEGAAQEVRAQMRALGFRLSHQTTLTYIRQLSVSVQELLVGWGAQILGSALALTVHLATIFVMVFYMLVDGARLRTFLFDLSPLPDDEDALIVDTFSKVSKGVVVGNGLGSLFSGLVGGVAMWAVGLPSPAVWGGVMALFSFLPFIGVSVVLVPASVFLYLHGQHFEGIALLVVCAVLGIFVENVVKTKMIGSSMRMHDLLVFLSVLGGIGAFGIVGIIYGPLIVMMFITFSGLYQRRYRPQLARRFAKRRD